MYLYHFSEEPNIELFVPKQKQNINGMPPVVWAIDQEHEVSYYFPRDCPRIILRKPTDVINDDINNFFTNTTATTIITVESQWYPIMKSTLIYRYVFSNQGFEVYDKTAGYYISSHTIKPIRTEYIDHLVEKILASGAELRFTENLHPLRDSILSSGFQHFGIHRFKNAKKRPE